MLASMPAQKILSATIAAGATTSGVVDVGDNLICAVGKAATADGTSYTFTGATTSGGTYRPIKTPAGAAVTVTFADETSEINTIDDPTVFMGIPFIKLVTASQTTDDAVLELYCIPI